jgi:hypothetical protein
LPEFGPQGRQDVVEAWGPLIMHNGPNLLHHPYPDARCVYRSNKPPPKWTLSSTITNMYLTPGTIAVICAMLLIAAYIAFRITWSR